MCWQEPSDVDTWLCGFWQHFSSRLQSQANQTQSEHTAFHGSWTWLEDILIHEWTLLLCWELTVRWSQIVIWGMFTIWKFEKGFKELWWMDGLRHRLPGELSNFQIVFAAAKNSKLRMLLCWELTVRWSQIVIWGMFTIWKFENLKRDSRNYGGWMACSIDCLESFQIFKFSNCVCGCKNSTLRMLLCWELAVRW